MSASLKAAARPYAEARHSAEAQLSPELLQRRGEISRAASMAWASGASQSDRWDRIGRAVRPLMEGLSLDDLRLLGRWYQAVRSGAVQSAQRCGSVACGGPNSALDEPGAVMREIDRILGIPAKD